MTKLAEIQQAILRLEHVEQQSLRHWLDEMAEETPAMLAALDHGLDSLVQEAGVPIAEVRARLHRSGKSSAKPSAKSHRRAVNRGPSFGEWARRVSGMMKDAPPDLSTRGFGS